MIKLIIVEEFVVIKNKLRLGVDITFFKVTIISTQKNLLQGYDNFPSGYDKINNYR
jgi:hypothetical protein